MAGLRRLAAVVAPLALAALSIPINFTPVEPAGATAARELEAQVARFADAGFRDSDGRKLPLLVHDVNGKWLTAVPAYSGAILTSWSPNGLRVAAGVVATANVLLLYFIVKVAFKSIGLAMLGATLLLLTPAHLTFARTAAHDGIWHVVFAEAWLLAVVAALESPKFSRAWLVAAGIVAASVYSQPSAALMLPILSGITIVVLRAHRSVDRRGLLVMCAVAAITLAPLMVWLLRNPSVYDETFGTWLLHPAHIRYPHQWVRTLVNWNSLSAFFKTYWDFFSPSHLLISERAAAFAGVFSIGAGVLLLAGVYARARSARREDLARIVSGIALAAFVLLPIGAATFKEARAIERALAIVPMGIVVATYGLQYLWQGRRTRFVAIVAVAAAVLQSLW